MGGGKQQQGAGDLGCRTLSPLLLFLPPSLGRSEPIHKMSSQPPPSHLLSSSAQKIPLDQFQTPPTSCVLWDLPHSTDLPLLLQGLRPLPLLALSHQLISAVKSTLLKSTHTDKVK